MKIEKFIKNKNKYKVVLENNEILLLHEEVILKHNLLLIKKIDDSLLNKIIDDNKYYELYNKCIKKISIRLRSEKEIIDFLKLETDLITTNKIIEKLKTNKFINDLNFIKCYINDKINFSNDGPYKIKDNLLNYNIETDLIDKELSFIDSNVFYNKAKKLIDKKIKTNKKDSTYVLKQKIKKYLFELGYDYNLYENLINKINVSNIENVFEIMYRKLKIKYNDKELINKLKTKLYQKGYSMEEINNIIEKKQI